MRAHHYHAGMTPKQRIKVQNQWRSGELQVGRSASPVQAPPWLSVNALKAFRRGWPCNDWSPHLHTWLAPNDNQVHCEIYDVKVPTSPSMMAKHRLHVSVSAARDQL